MRQLVHKPRGPQSGRVDHLWFLSDSPSHARERIVPSGTVELVFNLAEDEFRIHRPNRTPDSDLRFPGALVSGCYRTPFEIDARAHSAIVGVHFRPGGAAGVLGIPPGKLADAHVALEDVWGDRASALRERLCRAPGPRQAVRVLEESLVGWLGHVRGERRAVKHALARVRASNLSKTAPVSARRLRRMHMDTNAAVIRYQVRDVDRAVAFYTQHLGFQLARRPGPVLAIVSRGDLHLILGGPGSSGSRPMPDGRQQEPGSWNRIVLYVECLHATIAALKAASARFRNQIEVGPGGKQIQIDDPDGNPIELHEAPTS